MNQYDVMILAYIAVISIAAVCVTVHDKEAAKRKQARRVPEATLMLIAAMFGSFAMFVTMKLIRHKTKHLKFMVGIPILMLLQIILIAVYVFAIR